MNRLIAQSLKFLILRRKRLRKGEVGRQKPGSGIREGGNALKSDFCLYEPRHLTNINLSIEEHISRRFNPAKAHR